jgi:hypothetical protein
MIMRALRPELATASLHFPMGCWMIGSMHGCQSFEDFRLPACTTAVACVAE